ncbi:MAG: DUF748 domain-containing protein [Pseudomonadota bacterium]
MTVEAIRHKLGWSRQLLWGVLAGLVLLLILRIAATPALQWYVNNKLDESPQYAGQVGDIDLMVLLGAYNIENVEIIKTEGDVPVPLFAAREVKFSLVWRALLNGAAVGEAELFDPQINIVDSNDESKKQTGEGGQWLSIIEDLFPFRIDRAIIHNGELHFSNFDSEPKMDIFLTQMEAEALNLASRRALTDSPIAQVKMAAKAMEVSDLTLGAAFDPSTEKPTFDVNARLLQLPILQLDNFIRTYAPFDVEGGTLDVATELAARDGQLNGYVKPIIYNLNVFDWQEDIREDKDNPLRALWEGLVGGVAQLLENQPRDQLASYIPLEGDVSNPDTNVFVAVAGILKNAFVEAYRANLDNTVSLFLDDGEVPEVALPAPLTEEDLVADLDSRQQIREDKQQAEVREEVKEEVAEEELADEKASEDAVADESTASDVADEAQADDAVADSDAAEPTSVAEADSDTKDEPDTAVPQQSGPR